MPRNMLILPGITDEEIARLEGCLRMEPMKGEWDFVQGKNQYALLGESGDLQLLFDDITDAGVSGAKPLVDFQPYAGAPLLFGFGGGRGEFPDSLIGKTVVLEIADTGYEETWTIMSKNTVKLSRPFSVYRWEGSDVWHAGDYQELIMPVAIDYVSDHYLVITALPGEEFEESFFLDLMIPGMSGQELAFCREYIAQMSDGVQPSSVPIDGNHYYTFDLWGRGLIEPEIR